jgi:LAO/AO transport system kinase
MRNAKSWFEALRAGDRRALARAATWLENRAEGWRELARLVHEAPLQSRVVGITGSPGAGKSTLTSALAQAARERQLPLAVLAIDPSSPFSGGAILGDRIRMLRHSGDGGVFIRSMATRGAAGGLAPAAYDLCRLLEAAGFPLILIETVGAGQDETEVAGAADAVVVTLAPGMGDDVQAIKAGILEIGDIYALNKADLPGAERLEAEMRAALELSGWERPVLRVSALEGTGIRALLDAMLGQPLRRNEAGRLQGRLRGMLREEVMSWAGRQEFAEAAGRVASGLADPYTVIEEWLARHRIKEHIS